MSKEEVTGFIGSPGMVPGKRFFLFSFLRQSDSLTLVWSAHAEQPFSDQVRTAVALYARGGGRRRRGEQGNEAPAPSSVSWLDDRGYSSSCDDEVRGKEKEKEFAETETLILRSGTACSSSIVVLVGRGEFPCRPI